MNAKIIITPQKLLHGEKVSIFLKGFKPHQKLTLKASLTDKKKKVWSSSATFQSDENGEVDLTKMAPISGSYSGIEPMGMLVYMKEEDRKDEVIFWEKGLHDTVVRFSVLIDGKEISNSPLVRYLLAQTVIQEQLSSNLKGTLFLPNDSKNQKVILCLSGSDGSIPDEWAAMFASHGVAAISLGYFAQQGLPKNLSKIPLEYFEQAFSFIKEHPNLDEKNITIIGASRGAELALLLASRYSINSVIAYAPSHVLWSGFGTYKDMKSSSWSYQDNELPFIQVKMTLGAFFKYTFSKKPTKFTPTFLHSLKSKVDEKAIIKVENIKGDILLISGEDDEMWCSTLMAKKIISRLKKYDFRYRYTHLNYKNAGHFITVPYYPSTHKIILHPHDKKLYALGGTTLGDLRASEDSWLRVLEFIKR